MKSLIKGFLGWGGAIACGITLSWMGTVSISWADNQPSPSRPALETTSNTRNTANKADTRNVLVAIRREGGMCAVFGCFSEVAILTDGTYRYSTHQSKPVTGRISPLELRQLKQRIARTRFDRIRSNTEPMEKSIPNLCMLPVDGPEAVYTFHFRNRVEQIRGCKTYIDANNRLFQQLERLYQDISERASEVSSVEVVRESNSSLQLFSEGDRRILGTLPVHLANTVMHDAQQRSSGIGTGATLGVRLESVKALTWNECQGGGERPTPPIRGICPDIKVSGWKMVVATQSKQTPFHWVYYIPQTAVQGEFTPTPDGLQSLPSFVEQNIRATVMKQPEMPRSQFRIQTVHAILSSSCSNGNGVGNANRQAMACLNQSRSGWQIGLLTASVNPTASLESTLWLYETNLLGTEVRLVHRGSWAMPPVAPPPVHFQ
jgi:hypothetical protein